MAKPQNNDDKNGLDEGKGKQPLTFEKYMIRKNWIARRQRYRDHYLVLYHIFENYKDENGKWRFDKDTQQKIVLDYMKETGQNRKQATREIATYLSSRLMRDDPNLLKSYQTFALDNLVWGIEATKQEMDYQNHRGYVKDFSDIIGLTPKETKKEEDPATGFMLFKDGETRGIVARGNPSEVIKYIQSALGPKLPGMKKALPEKKEQVIIDAKAQEAEPQTRHNTDRPAG